MRIAVLASGSLGNALLVSTDSTSVLVDAGISARRVSEALREAGVEPESLQAVLVSHEHSDHVSGLGPVARRFGLPVYATQGTHAAIDGRLGECPGRVVVEPGTESLIGDLRVVPFATSHDCTEPVGFSLTDGRSRVAIATDLGVVSRGVRRHLAAADCVVLEFNHDERMLVDGPYPWPLKARIMSNVGHLSNEAAAREVASLAGGPMSVLILAHLSKENNEPGLALDVASTALKEAGMRDVEVLISDQSEVLGPVDVDGGSRRIARRSREGAGATCTR